MKNTKTINATSRLNAKKELEIYFFNQWIRPIVLNMKIILLTIHIALFAYHSTLRRIHSPYQFRSGEPINWRHKRLM